MISVTKLLCHTSYFGDSLRYNPAVQGSINGVAKGQGPVVVWNCTKTCNLKCLHCYSSSDHQKYQGELSSHEGKKLIEDLSAFKVPVLLFSGGEPLLRNDIMELAKYAVQLGIRATFSTNGTLIDKKVAQELKEIGVGYVGISLDGIGSENDKFRGVNGAFAAALRGIEHCLAVGQRVGLRFTINKFNIDEMAEIFSLIKDIKIPRVCFYHLVYSGRGSGMIEADISHQEKREVLDLIAAKTLELNQGGLSTEILTVDNHADGIYFYLKLKKRDAGKAEHILSLLKLNGGNRSGMAIANVDWCGNVHPDQFTQNHTLGNIREKSFAEIWTDLSQPLLAGLKNRKALLKGRCASCKWLDACNGNFRARAEAVTGDFWESDPACYLTDSEIS